MLGTLIFSSHFYHKIKLNCTLKCSKLHRFFQNLPMGACPYTPLTNSYFFRSCSDEHRYFQAIFTPPFFIVIAMNLEIFKLYLAKHLIKRHFEMHQIASFFNKEIMPPYPLNKSRFRRSMYIM